MGEPVKRNVLVLEADYSSEAKSIVILGECQEGQFRTQIHQDALASYGNRSVYEIEEELKKTARMMIGKRLNIVFDPDLDERLKSNGPLKY